MCGVVCVCVEYVVLGRFLSSFFHLNLISNRQYRTSFAHKFTVMLTFASTKGLHDTSFFVTTKSKVRTIFLATSARSNTEAVGDVGWLTTPTTAGGSELTTRMFVHLQNRSVLRRTVRYAHSRYLPASPECCRGRNGLGHQVHSLHAGEGGGGVGYGTPSILFHARGGVWDTKYILFTPGGGVWGHQVHSLHARGCVMGHQVHSLHARVCVWDTKYILFTPGGCMGHQVHSLHARGVYGTPSTFSSRQGGVWDTKYILFTPGGGVGCMGHQVHSSSRQGGVWDRETDNS